MLSLPHFRNSSKSSSYIKGKRFGMWHSAHGSLGHHKVCPQQPVLSLCLMQKCVASSPLWYIHLQPRSPSTFKTLIPQQMCVGGGGLTSESFLERSLTEVSCLIEGFTYSIDMGDNRAQPLCLCLDSWRSLSQPSSPWEQRGYCCKCISVKRLPVPNPVFSQTLFLRTLLSEAPACRLRRLRVPTCTPPMP